MNKGFSPKQLEIFKYSHSEKDAIICDGSVRSGKSSAISIAFLLWSMKYFKNKNFAICSNTISTAVRNIIKPLEEIAYLNREFEIRYFPSRSMMTVTRGKKINYYYLFGGKDESSYQSVQGITLAGAFLDEVALMPESFVNQVLARCSVDGSKFWFSCNPESPEHWFKKSWIDDKENKNAKYLHFTMDDNPSLTEHIKDRYRSLYTGVFYDRYIQGLWVRAEGIIYKPFADSKEKYIVDEIPDDLIMISVGVDFGGNKSATSFVAVGFTRYMKTVYILESERITKELTPDLLDEEYVKFCSMVYDKYKIPFTTRADSAEPVLIRGLKNAAAKNQLKTSIKNALKTSIKSRIDLIVRLMGEQRIFFHRSATNAIKAYSEAIWDAKKTDVRLDDFSVDMDTIDATEYAIEEYTKQIMDASFIKE